MLMKMQSTIQVQRASRLKIRGRILPPHRGPSQFLRSLRWSPSQNSSYKNNRRDDDKFEQEKKKSHEIISLLLYYIFSTITIYYYIYTYTINTIYTTTTKK